MHFLLSLLVVITLPVSAKTRSVFVAENGRYDYSLRDVTEVMRKSGINYVQLKDQSTGLYKYDALSNEFQIKNWFLQDWYKLQDMWDFDQSAYITAQGASTFNEAKRKQYKKFPFSRKRYMHAKTPSMKEWGGLTHPPIKSLVLPLAKYDSKFAPINYASISSPYFSPDLQNEVDRVSRSELSFGNKVNPLADRFSFEKKKELIRNARETILMSSLVFVCDESTKSLVNLLISKHREGVDVKILVDGFINKILFHTECLKIMRSAGIEVLESKDFFRHKLKAIYHTKTLVVDFKEAVAGGQNMIDADNTSRSTDFKNRDIDLHITGPMVTDIAKQFVENWRYQTGLRKNVYEPLVEYEKTVAQNLANERRQGLRGKNLYAQILGNVKTRMNGVCRFIKQAPYEDRHTIGKAYLTLLNKVSKHLVIQDPIKADTYIGKMSDAPLVERFDNFDMFNLLHVKVLELAKQGKNIDYITTNINMAGNENVAMMNDRIKGQLENGKNMRANWSLAKLMASNKYYGKPHYENLMKDWMPHPTVNVWKHMSFLHSKVFYFDRVAASVGSYNFQHNATDQAYESTVICLDENLNKKLDIILIEDMVNSVPLTFSSLQ